MFEMPLISLLNNNAAAGRRTMTEIKCVVFWMLLTFLWTFSRGDTEVFCVFNQSCIIPCSFQPAPKSVIHWTHLQAKESPVHSYYNDEDQLEYQELDFRGRTSLFQDQISSGNASLLLRAPQIQDQGRYQCNTSTVDGNKVSLITVKVDAPVQTVKIHQVANRIVCSSDGVYPKPELNWSTIPPSSIFLQSSTIVQPTKQQLYSISSSLRVLNKTRLSYSCTIGTRSSSKTASLINQDETGLGKSIAVVLVCILVAVIMSTVPCIYEKLLKHRKAKQSLPLKVVSTDKETKALNSQRDDDEEENCLEKHTEENSPSNHIDHIDQNCTENQQETNSSL